MKPPRPGTGLIHHPYRPPEGFDSVLPGTHKASTVIFPNVAAMRSRDWRSKAVYSYGLHGTPTTFTLEARLSTLEGARHCVLTPSGLSALSLVNLALLQSGDELLLPENVYGPSRELAQTLLARWGITAHFYDPLQLSSARAALTARTRLMWIEAAGSVTMEFPDVPGLVKLAQEHGVLSALDNTWGAGLAFQPFNLEPEGGGEARLAVDICMHALTKYPSGGGDVLMGSVTTCRDDLYAPILAAHKRLGLGVGANDVEALLRSLPTLTMRYERQDHAARELAQWLQSQPGVSRVLHPALPGSPGHEHWKRLCTGAAGLFSILLEERLRTEAVDAFVDALRLFKIGYSWGGPMSLAVPYDLGLMRTDRSALPGHLVRFSIGLEAVEDLRADLSQALGVLQSWAGRS